jgi:hypothetical protein
LEQAKLLALVTDCDIALLDRVAARAADVPCHVPKADLVHLLTLGGFDADTVLWRQVNESADPVWFSQDGLRMLIDWALRPAPEV